MYSMHGQRTSAETAVNYIRMDTVWNGWGHEGTYSWKIRTPTALQVNAEPTAHLQAHLSHCCGERGVESCIRGRLYELLSPRLLVQFSKTALRM